MANPTSMMNRKPMRLLPSQCTAAPHRTHSCLWADLIIRCELHRSYLLAGASVPVSSAPIGNSLSSGSPRTSVDSSRYARPAGSDVSHRGDGHRQVEGAPSKLRVPATDPCFSP